jgi:uncharacterized membrane protein
VLNWEHLHLVTHSFPIVLGVSGSLVGLFGWARRHESLEVWGVVALLLGGLFVVPAYFTGLAAADIVAERTFVAPGVVQTHRYWATYAAIPLLAAGAFAGFALYENDQRLRRFVLIVGFLSALVVAYAAWLGSRIKHADAGSETPTASQPVAAEGRAGPIAIR